MTKRQTILAVIGLIIAMGIAGGMELEEEQQAERLYCEMVKLWKRSGGQAGWPAYNGEDACRTSRAERDVTMTKGQKE